MAVQITIDQLTRPPGTPAKAREDLVLGQPVTLSTSGGPFLSYQWRIVHKPIDIMAGARATSLLATPNAASSVFTPIDVEGTYHIEVAVDSGSGLGALPADVARITFYAGATLAVDPGALPRRVPAFQETVEHNVNDAIDLAGNTEGWSREWYRWFEVIRRGVVGASPAWGRVAVPPGGPASLTSSLNIASATYIAMGIVDIAFIAPMPNANYAVVASARSVGGSCNVLNENVNGFRVERADAFGVLSDLAFNFDVRVRP
jgi:hypothetical protein